jgi:hypothetical protein
MRGRARTQVVGSGYLVLNLADGRPRLFRSILGPFGVITKARQPRPGSSEMTCVPFSSTL